MTLAPPTPAPPVARIATFLDLIKFAHSIFALPFALIAAFWTCKAIGWQRPGGFYGVGGRLVLILACMVIARTFAMTFNRLVDRRYDAANPRTAKRPSVTGAVSDRFMTVTVAICSALFMGVTDLFDVFYRNAWPFFLSIPVLAWLAGYSYTKRFTSFCHFWLGISLGLAPLSVWIAIAPPQVALFDSHILTILLLGIGVTFWVAGFDILYALQDETFDRTMKLKSLPAFLGRTKALAISRLCHLLTLVAFVAVGLSGHFHWLYWLGFSFAALMLLIEQSLVKPSDISRVNLAFMTANGLIGLIFGALAIADILLL